MGCKTKRTALDYICDIGARYQGRHNHVTSQIKQGNSSGDDWYWKSEQELEQTNGKH